ncbi:MAG: efflux RND transporter permease subunit [bacterium]
MSFAQTVVDNRYAVGALTLAAAIFGVLAYLTLPMQLFPDTAPPLINVVTMYPGASAEDVAQNLSRPLEEEFARLEGVNKVKSSSQDNLSLVTVEFNYTEDVNLAAVDAQNALARIRGDLPGDIREPQVLKFSTSDRPIITVGVRSAPMTLAREAAEDVLVPRLQRISGVAGVDVFGGAQRSVLVEVDLAKARAFAVPLARVVEAIAGQNVSSPAGSYRTETTRTTFRIEAEATRLEALSAMVLPTSDGVPLRLGDIATISDGALESDATFGIDGKRAIAMQVFRAEDANTVAVVNGVLAEVERLRRDYPDLEFLIGEESATFTERSISNLLSNVWQALLLASLLIFLFIGRVKASFVAVVSMPLSYGMTFALMKVSGTEFNMVTLTAVILAVGMVVDASVVVLENIIRKMDEGLSPEQAAVEGTDEVFMAVLAGAATTMAVLVPLLFLSGFIGKTFGPLALTLLYAFLSSVVVALVLVPVLSLYTGASRLDAVAMRVAMPFNRVMDGVQAAYGALLSGALQFRWVTMGVGFLMLVAGGGLMATRGMEVLPKMDGGSFFVSFQTAPGSSVEATTAAVAAIEEILAGEPEIVKVQSQAGFEQGMKISATSGAQGPTQGFITATLTPRTEREDTIWTIEGRVRKAVARVPGIESFTVRELGNSAKATTSAPILVRVSGVDPLILDRLGDEVLVALGEVPDVVQPVRNWEIDQERMQVDVDTLRAAELGLSPALVARQLIMGSDGVEAGSLRGVFGESTPIRVRYARAIEMEASDLLDYPVVAKSATGPTTVPMRAVATVTPVVGPSVVTREAYVPNIEVSAFAGDIPLSMTLNVVKARMAKLELPRGYTLEVAGESNDLAEARGSLLWALGIAVVAVYLLLVAQLKSWLHPVTIMMSVPLSLIGVGLALKLGGKPISMPVMVGLILLVGIVVNNAIILIEFIRQARDTGTPRRQALMDSVAIRFRPIMMTSLSTIVGMVPLAAEWALGAERFSPLALAVLGGMITATFLTLVMIPVLYDVLDDVSVKVGRLFGRSAMVALVLLVLPMNLWAAEPEVAMSLAEAERLAVRTSHSLQAQSEEVVAMEESADQALARRLPKLEVQAAYTRLSEVEPGNLTLPMALPGQEPTTMQLGR